jgi:hypothetical protein
LYSSTFFKFNFSVSKHYKKFIRLDQGQSKGKEMSNITSSMELSSRTDGNIAK